MSWISVALCTAAYLLGGLSAGYWLVRWRAGRDVREQGSGATGATNVGRVLGARGFALTLSLDAAKGALAVLAARALDASSAWTFASAVAVVAGHVWPAQLGFRGGKGVAPLLGAWLVLAPFALAPCLALAALALALSRRFVPSGLAGLALLPAGTWWATKDATATLLSACALTCVLCAHRDVLRGRNAARGTNP
jgi:glycerol-3-phosphate acyltransferase PlsY